MTARISLRDLEDAQVGPPMHSRKNRVFRSSFEGRECIVKVYRGEWRERAALEYGVLRDCCDRGVMAAVPLALLDHAIVMGAVEGEVASEAFDRMFLPDSSLQKGQRERFADALAEWLSTFHAAFDSRLSRGDTILRNFIMSPGGVVGLDFEEASRTDTISDLGQICASAIMTDPPFTQDKMDFAGHMVRRYWHHSGEDRSRDLAAAVSAAIRHYAPFRSNGGELLSYASRIDDGDLAIG